MFSIDKIFKKEESSGKGYIILNVVRVLNIIALLTIVAASWVMLVMTVKTSSFFFFDGVSHFVTNAIGIFLVISEIGLFKLYFRRWWPLLSNEAGFVPLGLSMVILGFNILGHLNKEATSVENLGLPLWRIVIASGIVTSIMGFVNITATYIFCNGKITSRQVRSKGANVTKDPQSDKHSFVSRNSSYRHSRSRSRSPSPTLPSYNTYITSPEESQRRTFLGMRMPIRISQIGKPRIEDPETLSKLSERSSPLNPNLQRPPTALHPAMNGGVSRPKYAASSVYSVATNITGFPRHNVI